MVLRNVTSAFKHLRWPIYFLNSVVNTKLPIFLVLSSSTKFLVNKSKHPVPALFAIGELNERKNSRILPENEMTKSTIYNEVIPVKIRKFRSLPFWSTCFSSESPDFAVIILH